MMGTAWRLLRFAVMALVMACLGASIATAAAERVALVIGNSTYDHASVLPNPGTDAKAIAAALERLGFEVSLRTDLSKATFERELADFSERAADSELALVYYAGHGMEMQGRNYLIPTDARLKSDLRVKFETISLEDVLSAIESAKGLKLVLLDACRDNPFLQTMSRQNKTRSTSRGLAKVETYPGVLVSYAAAAGTVAEDGQGQHSPYAAALLDHLETPGLELSLLFRKVADDVQQRTDGRQTPFEYGRLPGTSIYLKAPPEIVVPEKKEPEIDACRDAAAHWAAIADKGDEDLFNDHLTRFGTCAFSTLAKLALADLRAEKAQQVANAKARAQADAKAEADAQAAAAAKAEADAQAAAVAKAEADARAEAAAKAEADAQAQAVAKAEADAKAAAAAKAEADARAQAIAKAEADALAEAAAKAEADAKAAAAKAEADAQAAIAKAEAEANAAAKAEAERLEKQAEIEIAALPTETEKKPALLLDEKRDDTLQVTTEPAPTQEELALAQQKELDRLGCEPGTPDGKWGRRTRTAMEIFNRETKLSFETTAATMAALDAMKVRNGRICPLVCSPLEDKVGERCVAKTCPDGQDLNSSGICFTPKKAEPTKIVREKKEKPAKARTATREKPAKERPVARTPKTKQRVVAEKQPTVVEKKQVRRKTAPATGNCIVISFCDH